MRIATIVPSLRRAAPVFVAAELGEGFLAHGHDVTLFHLDDVIEFEPSVPRQRLAALQVGRLAGFDIVHSHGLRPDLMVAMARRLLRARPRFVSTLHNYVREDLANSHGAAVSAVVSPLWATAWKAFDARVVLSRDAQSYYEAMLPGKGFACIPNGRSPHRRFGPPVAEQAMLEQLRARYRILGANAVVTPRKGLDQVIRALVDLPQYAFVVAGSGPILDELTELARALGVGDRFISLGFKDNARAYLEHYDVYVMPSRSEGLPLALLEAAAAGLSLVCSRLPVFQEVFDEEQVSFFDLDDTASLRRALLRAHDERERLGAAALCRFEEGYSSDVMVRAYLALFARLCMPEQKLSPS